MAQVAVMERTATYTNLAPEARCLYDIYKKEGDVFYCRRKYKKALLSYNEALQLANHSAQTLVARSRCYMGIGMLGKALEDTESALSISKTYLPAVYQKAQILYRQGNYELALMMFNRGHKLNPSAPGFLEGVQKAQHAMDILTTGRNMKTTVVGDLSLYVPKKATSFSHSRRPLPGVGKSHDSSKSSNSEVRLPSPGFSKRHGMILVNTQKRQPPVIGEASYGREGKRIGYLDDRAMREILGQLYDDKQYFERILNSNAGHKGDDLSGMLNSVLEDGLKFLYDRVLFWAQNGSLPPVAPHPTVVAKHYMQLQQQGKVAALDAETNSGEMSDGEESEEELIKVNQAIDAVSSVNDPDSVISRRKKKLLIRKRRADILRKRASMVVVTRKKPKKIVTRDSKESVEDEAEQMTPSRIQFHFSSLLTAAEREELKRKMAHKKQSLPEGSKVSWEDDSATESGLTAVDDREEERQRQRVARRLRKQQQREAERKKQEEEAKEGEKDQEPQEDPLAEYLEKVMNAMEELYQKGDLKALKIKAESFLLTMERYDPSIVGTKMAYLGRAHSYLGNAHLGFRHYDFALMHHEKDLEIGQRWKIPECQSRALGNIGRTHISMKKYSIALKYLAQKSKMVSEPKETAWLYHEIAGCFLQLHHYRFAQDAVSKALAAAQEANDSLYLMQASVLQGAILVKLQQYEKAYGSFERAMEYAKLRDDRRAQQAITEALAEVNEKIAQQAKDMQSQETSVIEAIEGGVVTQNLLQEQEKQLDAIQEQQEAEANSAAKTGVPQETQAGGEQDNNEKSALEEEEPEGKKPNTVSAGSAANTGEDPELLALVSDEEEEKAEDAKQKEKLPENDKKENNKNKDEKESKADEKGKGKKEKKKGSAENDNAKNTDEKIETVDKEKSEQPLKQDSSEQKANEEKQREDETKVEPEAEKKNTDEEGRSKQATSAPITNEADKEDKNDTVGKENHQDEKIEKSVSVVVTGAEEPAVNEENEKEDQFVEMDKAQQETKPAMDSLSANVGPDATYKERPITADSLAKSMTKDKGLKHEPDQTVVALNNSISREASRVEPSTENKQEKKVTIAEVDEKAGEKGAADKEREEAAKSPVEPRGKDPVTDKLEDDLKLMAQDFNEKEFDSVIKRGGEVMKALKKAKNIDAWSKRRLRNFAKVHSYLGSANSEKQNFDKARMHHNADLKIGEAMKEPEIQSRALEHLGRTFIFENKLEKALEFFAKRAHLPRDTEDTARLFHEIANCFFQLKAYEFAKDAAMVSLKAANEGGHTLFQLQSSVLIAVMKVKLNRVDTAFETFEEAMKYAVIRDDQDAAEAIRGAMKQIKDRVASKVRDKWLAKIGKKPANAQAQGTSGGPQGGQKETGDGIEQEQPQIPTVSGIIKALEEKEEDKATKGDGHLDAEGGEPASDLKSSQGKKDGLDTHRSEFLDAPDGALEHKQSGGERVVKIELPPGEESVGFAPRKVPKKKTNTAGKPNATKKPNEKESPPKNSTVQALGVYSVKKAAPKDDSLQKANASKGPTTNKNKVTNKSDNLAEGRKSTENPTKTDTNNKDEASTVEADQAGKNEIGETAAEAGNEGKNVSKQDNPQDVTEKTQVSKPRKSVTVKPPPGFYDHTHEDEVAHRAKLRQSYVAPKPKVKNLPAITVEEEELMKQAMLERRKSQRFIGLDPEKVAQAKVNPPKPIQDENPPPPKPKLERFVGLKIKQGWKPPKKRAKTEQGNESDNEQNIPRVDEPKIDDKVEQENFEELEPHDNLMVPSVELLTPLPRFNDSHDQDGDVGYDANMPSTQMMVMNEELPMLRKDSVGSRPSRPATRLSLVEMVRDDTEVTPKGASKAELSALNALVQDSIRQDKDEKGKTSPPKVILKKPEPTFREKRLAEERAALERARRRRFLANQKASFILMLTSPYAEVPSLKNRRNSQWFPLLRRRTTVPYLAVDTSAGDSGNMTEDASPRKNYDDDGGSPRKYVKQSDKDVLPRRASKKDIAMAIIHGEDATASEKHRLAIAAKEMRRKERETRREERKKLQETEKRRRQQEREGNELLKLTPRANYPNPYIKPPNQIPGLEHHYVPSPEEDNMELEWRREGERMLRREKLRAKREKEVQRLTKEEARRRKFGEQPLKKPGVSPQDKESQEKDEDYTANSAQLDDSPELTPEYDAETPLSPRLDETQPDDHDDDNDNNKEDVADQSMNLSKEEKPDEGRLDNDKKKKKDDKKKSEDKPGKIPGEDNEKDKEKTDEGRQEEGNVDDDIKEDEGKHVDEEFDGYNDDEEDKEDEIAIHIEREARQMKEDYNKGEIDAVIKRGTDLLKSLRKHTDIVSWSRRRLRWFGVAHSYMGSALADKGEHDKAKSHHQADFRIGEALGEPKMQSRALEHLARISIAENQIPKALEYLAKRAHLPRDSETSARLFLDMANCFLQMGALEFARDAAIQGLTAAKEGRHGTYQLQSSLLIAVCQTKLRDFGDAKDSFESALAEARTQNDVTTEASIQEAIEQLELKRATMVRDKWKSKKGGVEPTPITEAIQEDEEEEAAAVS